MKKAIKCAFHVPCLFWQTFSDFDHLIKKIVTSNYKRASRAISKEKSLVDFVLCNEQNWKYFGAAVRKLFDNATMLIVENSTETTDFNEIFMRASTDNFRTPLMPKELTEALKHELAPRKESYFPKNRKCQEEISKHPPELSEAVAR